MRIKTLLFTATLLFIGFFASAQEKSLTGMWELKKTKYGNQELTEVPIGLYKLFNADGTFSNMRLTIDGLILSHEGSFKLSAPNVYSESVKTTSLGVSEKQNTLNYELSTDGNTLSLKGKLLLDDGVTKMDFYEEWKRVKVENP